MSKRILFIVGSLRKNSFNRQLAREAEGLLAGLCEAEFLDYSDVPLFSQDLEAAPPEAVTRVRTAVEEADGIWIFSPEYNHSIPGGLKNLLDWLSRETPGGKRLLAGKHITHSGAGGATGTACMQDQLMLLLNYLGMKVMNTAPRAAVSLSGEEFTAGHLLLSDMSRRFLKMQAEAFAAELEK